MIIVGWHGQRDSHDDVERLATYEREQRKRAVGSSLRRTLGKETRCELRSNVSVVSIM